jgi:allophanate hydrolase
MSRALLHIDFAGPHVSLQDGGRPGHMRFGVPASGPMDRLAFAAANLALGNPADQAGIEVSAGGLALTCREGTVTLAIAGGGFIVQTGGQRLGSWTVLTLVEGDRLTLRPGPWGSWAYLAFAARIDAPPWLESLSTHAASGMGGGAIVSGQDLILSGAETRPGRHGPIPCPVMARPRHRLRCVPGPQDRFFAAEVMEDLARVVFQVSEAYDRMGTRLKGPALPPLNALGIPSEPILRGSVQVSGDGVPTVLMADHQTTGGYPKIATVLGCDLDAFAQCRPRDRVGFVPVTPDDALMIARAEHRRTQAYFASLASTALCGPKAGSV